MRALRATGWLNFRMRAMVMSVGAHHCNYHGELIALYLATQFVDYEPGIHYSQCQMQAGRTGINAIRIYNPIKQGRTKTPTGYLFENGYQNLTMSLTAGFIIHGNMGIIHQLLMKHRLSACSKRTVRTKKEPLFKKSSETILKKHGSRRNRHLRVTRCDLI